MLQNATSKTSERSVHSTAGAALNEGPTNPEPITVSKREHHPDTNLLDQCTFFAMNVAGAWGAFDVDPTADNDFANEIDDICRSRSLPCLVEATRLKATTLDGLRAKAEMTRMLIKNAGDGMSLEDEELAFIRSLLDDVTRFQRACPGDTSRKMA